MMVELGSHSSTQQSLDWAREQIEMRVIGLCWIEFKTQWSSSKDEGVGNLQTLIGKQMFVAHEQLIIMEDNE